ncbi:QRFP-like peptide receptor [Folsomia candida]|uniref:Neuropeptide Y receptor n=1 Tax=Folsomia candida TaxID=158441 RepID=A0A226EZB1_FOLCA|nr:QRFP-like peptide receptor [Folsomia candida]OXA62510.1 Neuropeptide Y receptor [Folsomia candida]
MHQNLGVGHFFLRNAFQREFQYEEQFRDDDDYFDMENLQSDGQECSKQPDYFVPEDTFISLPDWSEALFAVGNIIVLISAICGNIGSLLILYKSQMSKRSTKQFLASLAMCDLILALTSPTVDLSQILSRYQSWIFGGFLCKVIPFIQTTVVMGVALFLVVIAAERYMYVVRALSPNVSQSPWRDIFASVVVAAVWIWSILVALPNLWYYEHKSFWTYVVVNGQPVRPRNETCSKFYYICARTTFDEYNVAYYSSLGLAILVPTIAFLFCYVSIIIFVRRHVVTLGQRVGSETRIARNRKTLRLILGLIFLNIVCRLPVWTFVVVTNIKETPANRLTLLLMYSFHLLSNVNSLINPFVYAIFNDSIRTTRNSGIAGRDGGGGVAGSGGGGAGSTCHESRGGFGNCCSWITSCCYHQIKATSVEYFLERKVKNNYDFTKNNSKFIPSVSTQRFNLSADQRNEFAVTPTMPKLSSNNNNNENVSTA